MSSKDDIIALYKQTGGEWTLDELAEELGYERTTIYKSLQRLIRLGKMEVDDSGKMYVFTMVPERDWPAREQKEISPGRKRLYEIRELRKS